MGDFLRYLYQCARNYIQETHAADFPLWDSFEGRIDFILTHPNSWDDTQRADLRRAAVHGGLVPDTPDGHSRIAFVSEGEASLHFCLTSVSSDVIKVSPQLGSSFSHIVGKFFDRATRASSSSMQEAARST